MPNFDVFYKLYNPFDFRTIRNLFLNTKQRIVLRSICLIQNTICLSNMFNQSFRETSKLEHFRIYAVKMQ